MHEPLDAHLPRGLQHHERTVYIGRDKSVGIQDGAVYMGFGGEVDDIVRALHRLAYSLLVAHIAVNEGEARVALHRREVLAPARVGQRVQHAHFVVGVLRQEVLGEVAADEPCAARN
jgi:hypothetical protein